MTRLTAFSCAFPGAAAAVAAAATATPAPIKLRRLVLMKISFGARIRASHTISRSSDASLPRDQFDFWSPLRHVFSADCGGESKLSDASEGWFLQDASLEGVWWGHSGKQWFSS